MANQEYFYLSKKDVQDFEDLFNTIDQNNNDEISKFYYILNQFQESNLFNNILMKGIDELKTFMHNCRLKVSEKEIQEMFDEIDEDGSGAIDMNEFLNLISMNSITPNIETELRQVFSVTYFILTRAIILDILTFLFLTFLVNLKNQVFDINDDGLIGWIELKALLIGINPIKFKDVDDEVFQAVIKVSDNDGDGSITFEEFVRSLIAN